MLFTLQQFFLKQLQVINKLNYKWYFSSPEFFTSIFISHLRQKYLNFGNKLAQQSGKLLRDKKVRNSWLATSLVSNVQRSSYSVIYLSMTPPHNSAIITHWKVSEDYRWPLNVNSLALNLTSKSLCIFHSVVHNVCSKRCFGQYTTSGVTKGAQGLPSWGGPRPKRAQIQASSKTLCVL